jgi:hypothetical protein
MHRVRRLRAGRLDQAKSFALAFIEPILAILNPVAGLLRQISGVGLINLERGSALQIMDVHVQRHTIPRETNPDVQTTTLAGPPETAPGLSMLTV